MRVGRMPKSAGGPAYTKVEAVRELSGHEGADCSEGRAENRAEERGNAHGFIDCVTWSAFEYAVTCGPLFSAPLGP